MNHAGLESNRLKAAVSSRKNKESRASVAYLHFNSLDALIDFTKAYQGHLFQDSKGAAAILALALHESWFTLFPFAGNISEALVEFAPFQKVPRVCKSDPRKDTIQDGQLYCPRGLSFKLISPDEQILIIKHSWPIQPLQWLQNLLQKPQVGDYLMPPCSKLRRSCATVKTTTALVEHLRTKHDAAKAKSKAKEKEKAAAEKDKKSKSAPTGLLTKNNAVQPVNTGPASSSSKTKEGKKDKPPRTRKDKAKEKEKDTTGSKPDAAKAQAPGGGNTGGPVQRKQNQAQSTKKVSAPSVSTSNPTSANTKEPGKRVVSAAKQRAPQQQTTSTGDTADSTQASTSVPGTTPAAAPRRNRVNPNNRLLNAALGTTTAKKRGQTPARVPVEVAVASALKNTPAPDATGWD